MITLSRKNIYLFLLQTSETKIIKNLGALGLNRNDLVGLIYIFTNFFASVSSI